MSALLQAPNGSDLEPDGAADDHKLVARVRRGDERAFEALYERYHRRIHAYVVGMVKDHQRAEDVTQEVFVSALRRMRATERPIAFKPWVYEIAKNACIDQFRRSKRSEEVSLDADGGLASSDYGRLVSAEPVPDAALVAKQQLDDLCGAFGGLSDAHHEILVLRELEGHSYQQIGEKMGMSRPAVESTLFRARRRLSEEYDELASGQRCQRIQSIIVNASGSRLGARDTRRLARHVAHCQPCRREALAAGVVDAAVAMRKPLRRRAIEKVAALFPFPLLLRGRRGGSAAGEGWAGQLPLVSEQAAAGGAKLIAVAVVVVAGLGAGVGTQVITAAGDDGPAARPAKAAERAAPQPGGGAGATASEPAGSDSSSGASERVRGGKQTQGDGGTAPGERGAAGTGTGLGSDAPRQQAASEGQSGGGGGEAPSGAGGTSPTDTIRQQGDSLQETVRQQLPSTTSPAPGAGDPAGGTDSPLPPLPGATLPQQTTGSSGSTDPVKAVEESVGNVTPQVPSVPEVLNQTTSGATAPVTEAAEDLGVTLPGLP